MRLLIQRVLNASVVADGIETGSIGKGFLILLGICDRDTKETVDKSIDFLFEDACYSFRTLPKIEDSIKEDVIKRAQAFLVPWKAIVTQTLIDKGVKVIFR